MAAKRMALLGGMGYPLTETPAGMPRLKARLEAIGFEVLLVNWAHRQEVYDFLRGFNGWRGLAGDSLGAGSSAQYAGDQKGAIQYVAGFQPSLYDARVHGGVITVAANVERAHCIYDPLFVDTVGLGRAYYEITPHAKTVLLTTEHRGAHPDDWGYSQDLILNEIQSLVVGSAK